MTNDQAQPGDDPRRLLSSTRELAQRVRKAQRATWFPLLVLALVTFAAIPVLRFGARHAGTCSAVPGGKICTIYSDQQFIYWPIALVLAYAVIAAFYIRRSHAQGVETRVRPYAIAGIVIAVALTALALWEVHNPPSPNGLSSLPYRVATPACAIGLGLLVLAWAERSRALLLLTFAYLVVVLAHVGAVQAHSVDQIQVYLPDIIHGVILLLGAFGFAIAQRPLRSPAS